MDYYIINLSSNAKYNMDLLELNNAKIKGKSIYEYDENTIVVDAIEPTGEKRKKTWIQHSNNLSPKSSLLLDIADNLRVNVIPNTSYRLKFRKSRVEGVNITNTYIYFFASIVFYDDTDTEISRYGINDTTMNGVKNLPSNSMFYFNKTFVTPQNCAYITFNLNNANGDVNYNTLVSDIELKLADDTIQDRIYILDQNDNYREFNTQKSDTIEVTLNEATNFYYNENYKVGNEIQLAGDVRVDIPSGNYSQSKLFTVSSQYKPILDANSDTSIRFPMIADNGAFGYAYIKGNGEVYAQIPSNPSLARAVYINLRYRYK